MAASRREVAHRMFASEYNACRFEIKGNAEERIPGYVVSPLGAKANRVFLAGVLTEVSNVGESGDVKRARVSDPTGMFTIYAGQYQPEVAKALSELQPPQYVAVVGKTRTYEPEPGQVYVSVRPEQIVVIDEDLRNHWIVETARRTKERIDATRAASKLSKPTPEQLAKLGVPHQLIEGAMTAWEKYGDDVDLDFFTRSVRESLEFLSEGDLPRPVSEAAPAASGPSPKPAATGPGAEIEKTVLTIIEGLARSDEKGAQWDLIVAQGQKQSVTEDQVEEALNALMDKGVIYEPILGRLKMT